ncbi:MAG TPA: glycosyltransferase family A protein [Chloroflexota bacterium]|nr:glycosyltransferase family A protein [Chloroflexota bacterium]HUM67661.1 glycosyltransferase family A protein [Chloroflexota bacterium]
MFSSTIIPTINRATLSKAVGSVLDQPFTAADFEVIVVNDSGQPLPSMDWQHSQRVRVIDTNRRERSVARNTGAAIARGKYLHFLDDDDYLLPGALDAFWHLDQVGGGVWLYGSYQTINNEGILVNEFHPELAGDIFAILVAGESIPFQVSFLRTADFFTVGGFDCEPEIIGVEDRDLGRRLAVRGPVVYTPFVVAQIRIGQEGSTTNWDAIFAGDRWGREKALRMQHAFRYLHTSAQSAYWHGRVCRAYVASAGWNLKRGNLFTAVSRSLAALSFTIPPMLSPTFWQGLRTKVK